jgi:hypothetical protein
VPTLSAIVPATDAPPTLGRCLAAVAAAQDPPDELIVVQEPAFLPEAEARNRAAGEATGELLVFVDSDVEVHADAFQRIRSTFVQHPELTALFGSYDDRIETEGLVAGFRNLLHHHVHQRSPGRAQTFWTGLGAIRRDAFLAAGGFSVDPRLRAIQDIELGGRLTQGGALIELDPELLGTHLKEWTLGSMVATDFRKRAVPWARLLVRDRSLPAALNLSWQDRASAALALGACAALVARKPALAGAATAGMVAINRDFYKLLLERLGPRGAAAGVGLHTLYYLTSAASIPVAIAEEATRAPGPSPARAG